MGTPPAEPPSWPGVPGVRRLGFETPAEVLSAGGLAAGPLESGLSGPGPHGCLPTGDRSALGRGPGGSDGHTSPWLIFGSDTGLASNSRRPARLPLSGQGVPSRVGGDGPRGQSCSETGVGMLGLDPCPEILRLCLAVCQAPPGNLEIQCPGSCCDLSPPGF